MNHSYYERCGIADTAFQRLLKRELENRRATAVCNPQPEPVLRGARTGRRQHENPPTTMLAAVVHNERRPAPPKLFLT
jgi:hypothetical protein